MGHKLAPTYSKRHLQHNGTHFISSSIAFYNIFASGCAEITIFGARKWPTSWSFWCCFVIFLSLCCSAGLTSFSARCHLKKDSEAWFRANLWAIVPCPTPRLDHWSTSQAKPSLLELIGQAFLWLVNFVTRLSNMADFSADEILPATKCVSERFQIDKVRKTLQDAILNC